MKIIRKSILSRLALATVFCFLTPYLNGQNDKFDAFRDSTDGAVDMSDFLLSVSGFLPIPTIITEPAVGYGGGMFGAYFHKKSNVNQTISQPDISFAGGGGTENESWFAGGGHMGFWKGGKIRYRGILFYAQPRLTFYLFENFGVEVPVRTTMNALFFFQSIEFRLGKSNWYAGGEYIFMQNGVKVNNQESYPILDPVLDRFEIDVTSSGLGAQFSYDGRDNIYSTNKGIQWSNELRYFPEALGSTREYGTFTTDFIAYKPIVENDFYLGFRNKVDMVFDSPPFYVIPSVNMRGVKRLRYQGEFINTTELEARFRVYKRWSVLGFGGVGLYSPRLVDFEFEDGVWAGGTGFRYLLARLFNLQAGLDFAWSEKDPIDDKNQFAFYITVGTAWNR